MSRISTIRRVPFQAVSPGDLLWFKAPSGPVRAIAAVGRCLFRELQQPGDFIAFIKPHRSQTQADEEFFADAATWARYVSLLWLDSVVRIEPMEIRKSDQRAWVILKDRPYPGMRIGPERSPRAKSSRIGAAAKKTKRRPSKNECP